MKSWGWTAAAAMALPLLLACGDEDEETKILPIRAAFTVDAVSTDPVVFLQQNPDDTSSTDDVVLIDVMLRDMTVQPFEKFNLEVRFDPGIVQIAEVDDTATPLGDCRSSSPCAPLCFNNVQDANGTGKLIIGVSSNASCPGSAGGNLPLLTLGFIASSIGTSRIVLFDGAGSGDCEILSSSGASLTPLDIPCDDGNATVIGTR